MRSINPKVRGRLACASLFALLATPAKALEFYCADVETYDWYYPESFVGQLAGKWVGLRYQSTVTNAYFISEKQYREAQSHCDKGYVPQPYSIYWLPFAVQSTNGFLYLAPGAFGDYRVTQPLKLQKHHILVKPIPSSAEYNFQLRV